MNYSNRRELLQMLAGAVVLPLASEVHGNEKTKPRIKIGQIGVGHPHSSKLDVYRNSKDYEVIGIVEPNKELRKWANTKKKLRGVPWITQKQLFNTKGLQAVLIETDMTESLDAAEICLSAGLHIHLDKPAGSNYPQLERIMKTASSKGLLVQMGYMYRYNPAVILLHQLLKRGWLGEVFDVHAVMSKVVPSEKRKKLARFSGGMMYELGCHLIDLVIGILGKPNKVTPILKHVGKVSDQLIDTSLAVLEYPKSMATVNSSALEVEGQKRRQLVVCGTEGTFQIQPLDNPTVRVAFSSKRGNYTPEYQDIRMPKFIRYVADAAAMAQFIRDEKPSKFSYSHDLIVQKTLLQACKMPLA